MKIDAHDVAAAMRDATKLIEEQRAAIDDLVQALRDIKSTLVVEEWLRPSYGWKEYVTELIDPLLAKHAPAPSQEGGDEH